MARKIGLSVTVTRTDTETDINAGVVRTLGLTVTDYVTDAATDDGFTLPVGGNKTITPSILNTSAGSRIQGIARFKYNVLETAAPEVELTVDGVVVTAGHIWANTFTTSLVIDASACAYPVDCDFTYYEMF